MPTSPTLHLPRAAAVARSYQQWRHLVRPARELLAEHAGTGASHRGLLLQAASGERRARGYLALARLQRATGQDYGYAVACARRWGREARAARLAATGRLATRRAVAAEILAHHHHPAASASSASSVPLAV